MSVALIMPGRYAHASLMKRSNREQKKLKNFLSRGYRNILHNGPQPDAQLPAPNFFHTLKMEVIPGERFATRAEMRRTLFGHIEIDYNRSHRHRANGHISLEVFESKLVA